jgi:serine/threonine-protein kinase
MRPGVESADFEPPAPRRFRPRRAIRTSSPRRDVGISRRLALFGSMPETRPMTHTTNSLRALFDAALALAPDERARFLDEQCKDAGERTAIERLLAADAEGDGATLDASLGQLVERVTDPRLDYAPPARGTRVGPFTLQEPLGEGGSSIVFRAEREQDGVRQTVALKLLHRGLRSADEERRFRSERHALAQLRHAGIARLIEGGITDGGAPYIALELVEGESITAHARRHTLGLAERLRLFVDVCRAVEAAHRALIVHRDIKPSNVFVTTDGDVKLLDFGIAKLLDTDGDGNIDHDATRTQQTALTPAYAAPEQFTHGAITTATDVYALGVLLGELVTGRRREPGDTRTPSTLVDTTAAALREPLQSARRRLRGDVDNIVMKAIEAEPENRYASAGALADDIERHLDGLPVAAHPPSSWYRARKFVARHRGGVVSSVAFVLAILAALGIALAQAERAREQARLADQAAARAGAVRDILVDIFDSEIPSRPKGEMPNTAELLERGAARATSELSATPAVQSDLLTALGRVYDHLALPDKGAPLLDAAVAAARRVDPPDDALLGAALSERGELALSRNRFDAALVDLNDAIALQKRGAPDSIALAISLDRRALAESDTGHHDVALADYQAALAIRRAKLPTDDPQILESIDAIGNALTRAGKPDDARAYLRDAVDGALAKFGEHHVKTGHYLKNLATAESLLRHYAEAAALTERAVAIERDLYPPGSPDVVNGLNNLGAMQLTLGRLQAARETLTDAAKRNADAGLGESLGQAFVLGNLARANEALGAFDDAATALDAAHRAAMATVGADHARTRTLELQAARVAFERDASKAPTLERVASSLLEKPEALAQFRSRSEPEARYALGLAQNARGDAATAKATWVAAVGALPNDAIDPATLPLVASLATLEANDDAAAATSLLTRFIERSARELPPTQPAVGELRLALGEILARDATKRADAIAALDAADAAFVELPPTHALRVRAEVLRATLR